MSAPERWLDAPREAPPSAAELLRSGLELEPEPSQKDAIWAALAANLGPGPGGDGGPDLSDAGGGDVGSAAAAKGGASASALAGVAVKSILTGLLAGGLVTGGYGALRGWFDEPAPGAPAVAGLEAPVALAAPEPRVAEVLPAPPSPPIETTTGGAPSPIARAEARAIAAPNAPGSPGGTPPREPDGAGDAPSLAGPSDGAVSATPEEARRSRLREESALVSEARGALRAGNAAEALTRLESARARFPDGVLGQEREALTIEALARSGQGALASARARAFLAAHPSSAHAERIQTFITP